MQRTNFVATELLLRGFDLTDEHTLEAGHEVTNGLHDWIVSLGNELSNLHSESQLTYWFKELYGIPFSPTAARSSQQRARLRAVKYDSLVVISGTLEGVTLDDVARVFGGKA